MTNNHLTFQLPEGYTDEAGTLHREVEMNPLTGKEEELVAQNHGQASALLVTMVLGRCMRRLGSIAPVPGDVIGRLPREDRQFLLFKLREITFGDRIQAAVTCPWPGCGSKADINFSTKDIIEGEHVEKEPKIELELEAHCPGCGREFTIPFDITGFFTRELRTTIDLLYREVHFLAYHYHWSEREILEMSREKRHKYIEILLEEIEKMTDERILPPGGFRYGNVNSPFMLETPTHEPFSRGFHPIKEGNKTGTGINGEQDTGDNDDEMNHQRMKTRQNHPMKNETLPGSDVRETREREDIEIPGFSEKSAAFPSLDRENPQSQNPQPLAPGGNTLEMEKCKSPGQQHPVKNSKEPGNKFKISNSNAPVYKKGRGGINPKTQRANENQTPNPGIQTKIKFQMAKSSQTTDRENPLSQKSELVDIHLSPGENEPRLFTGEKDKIEFSNRHPLEDKVIEIKNQLPGKIENAGTHTPMTVTGSETPSKPEPLKPRVTEIQLPGKPGFTNAKPVKVQSQSKSKSESPSQSPSQSPARIEKAVSSPGTAMEGEIVQKSTGYDAGTGESSEKVISTEEMVSRSSPGAVLRIEQLREQVRRLNEKKSSPSSHLSYSSSSSALSPPELLLSSTGQEDTAVREIKTGNQPAAIVRSIPARPKTGQTASAFWERSYLARYRLRTLR